MMSDQQGSHSAVDASAHHARQRHALRRTALGAIVLLVIEAGLGMAVNLYVVVPTRHSGAHPSNYFSGSVKSVGWAISHGAIVLAIHATFGLLLGLFVIEVVVRAARGAHRPVTVWAIVAGLLVIGAGFNGASFLDFNEAISSLLMALLTLAAIACYSVMMYLSTTTELP
jgi:hypothetical protein